MGGTEAESVVRCDSCGRDVPAGRYCVRCGNQLAPHELRRRRGFAAAPNESRFIPEIVSTIFPHLPRASLGSFRWTLVGGLTVVAALAAFRLFPLALVAAAAIVPLLTVVYFYDVDVYEDEPGRVVALTLAWGAATGAAVGLVARELAPAGSDQILDPERSDLVIRGIVLPFVSALAMLAGPLVLLPYRRFNDVLDGATFGAASAVAFVGAEVIAESLSLLETGFRPVADVSAWLLRLGVLGLALPVLSGAAVGAAAGSLWLRYRAPAGYRGALGVFGRPAVAVPLAVALVVAAGLARLALGRVAALALLLTLAALALVWLRQVLHVGLLQEAAEIPIGPEIVCANCGVHTPQHMFCRNCGISLRALPKARTAEGVPAA